MHHIQAHILDKLTVAKSLRNKDMRPPRVESNLYQYHLLQLQKDGYVKKIDATYTLTKRGLAYAVKHSSKLKKERPQPNVVTILFVENTKAELLVRTKQRQPFIGMKGLVLGKLHIDESIISAAKREFIEKVNEELCDTTFEQFGVAHIIVKQQDCVILDNVCILITARVVNDLPIKTNVQFYAIDDINFDTLSPGTKELILAYKSKAPFTEVTVAYDT